MNKEVVTIGSAVLAGAITRGATGMLLNSSNNTVKMGVNFAGCAGFGFLATKVSGSDTKAAALRGAAIGSSVAHGLLFIGNAFSTEKLAAKLANPSKVNTFLAKAAGLNGYDQEGLAGYIDAYGNYQEDGLAGYIDAGGNYIEDGLNSYDEDDYFDEEDGLNAYDEDDYDEEEGLNAAMVDEYGNIII